jgi:hypothetical protein
MSFLLEGIQSSFSGELGGTPESRREKVYAPAPGRRITIRPMISEAMRDMLGASLRAAARDVNRYCTRRI